MCFSGPARPPEAAVGALRGPGLCYGRGAAVLFLQLLKFKVLPSLHQASPRGRCSIEEWVSPAAMLSVPVSLGQFTLKIFFFF